MFNYSDGKNILSYLKVEKKQMLQISRQENIQ